MRALNNGCVLAVLFVACGVAAPAQAQTGVERPLIDANAAPSSTMPAFRSPLFPPTFDFDQVIQQPAGPPPTPRHTGIKALVKGLIIDFKHLPSRENLMWAGIGGGLALAVHPIDDNVNRGLVGNDFADKFFKPGEVLGELPTLLASASAVYAVGRLKDEPRVSHVGMDLIQSLAMSEALTQTLKYTTRRERPDGSGKNSFPSGHAADTFAFATALERHLGWRYAVPAYMFASYVAISRLPANRHWFSDAVFGASVGIIAGRTVTSHEAHPFPVAVVHVPGGAAVMYVHRGK
jgi:membrane-associated phospholipid phosphatase